VQFDGLLAASPHDDYELHYNQKGSPPGTENLGRHSVWGGP
jgi:hypothetical protein